MPDETRDLYTDISVHQNGSGGEPIKTSHRLIRPTGQEPYQEIQIGPVCYFWYGSLAELARVAGEADLELRHARLEDEDNAIEEARGYRK